MVKVDGESYKCIIADYFYETEYVGKRLGFHQNGTTSHTSHVKQDALIHFTVASTDRQDSRTQSKLNCFVGVSKESYQWQPETLE